MLVCCLLSRSLQVVGHIQSFTACWQRGLQCSAALNQLHKEMGKPQQVVLRLQKAQGARQP
jgi:hypothetical protein